VGKRVAGNVKLYRPFRFGNVAAAPRSQHEISIVLSAGVENARSGHGPRKNGDPTKPALRTDSPFPVKWD